MSGGGQVATATQQPSFSYGQPYGGMPIGNAYAQQVSPPTTGLNGTPQINGSGYGQLPHQMGYADSMDEGMVAPRQQTPLGIAGLQNNLPSNISRPFDGGLGGQGGGTDVIVHGMPVGGQQGMGGLQQMPSQQIMQMQNMIRPNMDSTTY